MPPHRTSSPPILDPFPPLTRTATTADRAPSYAAVVAAATPTPPPASITMEMSSREQEVTADNSGRVVDPPQSFNITASSSASIPLHAPSGNPNPFASWGVEDVEPSEGLNDLLGEYMAIPAPVSRQDLETENVSHTRDYSFLSMRSSAARLSQLHLPQSSQTSANSSGRNTVAVPSTTTSTASPTPATLVTATTPSSSIATLAIDELFRGIATVAIPDAEAEAGPSDRRLRGVRGMDRFFNETFGVNISNERRTTNGSNNRLAETIAEQWPWTQALATARRAGYGPPPVDDPLRSSESRDRPRRTAGNTPLGVPSVTAAPRLPTFQSTPSGSHYEWATFRPSGAAPQTGERMATAMIRRRRTEQNLRRDVDRIIGSAGPSDGIATAPRVQQYTYDPTDIAPPGGEDDHIWDMLGNLDSDDDEEDRWGVHRGPLNLPGSSTYVDLLDLDGWGTPPETGAALVRGRYNRQRQGVHERLQDSLPLNLAPRNVAPPREPTNVIPSQPPVLVRTVTDPNDLTLSSRGLRRRRRENEDEGDKEDELKSSMAVLKRRRITATSSPIPVRPSYLSHSSLAPEALLPDNFTPPGHTSRLTLTMEKSDNPDREDSDEILEPGRVPGAFNTIRPVITFTLQHMLTHQDEDASALRANRPIPSGCGVYYFEVEVLSQGEEGYMSVGWMLKSVYLRRLVGWDKGSWGWHGDDGKSFEGSGEGQSFSETWGQGDTVGCGIDYTTGRGFFTKNGRLMGYRFSKLPQGLYPAVGLRSPHESLAINFSGPFQFDIDGYVANVQQRVWQDAIGVQKQSFSHVPKPMRVPKLTVGHHSLHAVESPRGKELSNAIDFNDPNDGPRPHRPSGLPENSPLRESVTGSAAAFVFDHLAHAGHVRILTLLKRDMGERGWIFPQPPAQTSNRLPPSAIKAAAADYPSAAAALSALRDALASTGPIPWTLLNSLDPDRSATSGTEERTKRGRRIRIYDFVGLVSAAAQVRLRGRALEPSIVSNERQGGGEIVMGGDGVFNDTEVDNDAANRLDDEILSLGRKLRLASREERWDKESCIHLEAAFGLVACAEHPDYGHPSSSTPLPIIAHLDTRQQDAHKISGWIGHILGFKRRSHLEQALAQTMLVHDVLGSNGDGSAAFVSVKRLTSDV